MKIFPCLVLCAAVGAAYSARAQQCAGQLTPAQLDQRINTIIGQMSPAERIAQLQDRAPALPRLDIPAYNWWNEGLHGIARNGYATVFPQAIGLAATFDPALMRQVGNVVSTEARAKFNPHQDADSARYAGLTIWSPNINIFRDPRWGRGQETYGEDPYLTGTLGTQFVEGIQGNNPFYKRADATPKHFAVHSGPESLRDGFNSIVTPHDLTDTYLPAFQQLTGTSGAHADAMMCSYNAINGIPACANPGLLQDRVRDQWGFTGYVVSDCDAVDEVTEYLHYTQDQAHGAAASLKSGVDLDCGTTFRHLNESLAQGLVAAADIDRALHRLLAARMRLGMLQPASCSPYNSIPPSAIDTPADRALALRAAAESAVLLRNDKAADGKPLLPLHLHGQRIAVIGPTANLIAVMEANYHGTIHRPETLLDGLRNTLSKDVKVTYVQGATLAAGVTVPIPETAFEHGSLHAAYFANADLSGPPTFERQDQRVDFDFDHVSPLAPGVESSAASKYSVRWTGTLIPPAAGHYSIHIGIDRCFDCAGHDAYRLWLDNKLVLDDDGTNATIPHPDTATLDWPNITPHTLRLELHHTGEDQGIHLEWEAPAQAQLTEAIRAARDADIVLALVGLSPALEGEALRIKIPGFNGGDRETLDLPAAQRTLLTELAALHKPVIIGLTSGSPVATGDVTSAFHAPLALLQLWYPGEAGGEALAHLLTGHTNPSGRLPVTIYRSAEDLPAFTDYSMVHRTYRYFTGPVEYPFGFGLSYTSFRYSAPQISNSAITAGQRLQVRTTVTNAGHVAGDEVAELYLIPPPQSGAPRVTLQSVQRLHLNPGESRTVAFTLTPRQLSLVDADGHRAVRPGTYRIAIGGGQPTDLATAGAVVRITGEVPVTPD